MPPRRSRVRAAWPWSLLVVVVCAAASHLAPSPLAAQVNTLPDPEAITALLTADEPGDAARAIADIRTLMEGQPATAASYLRTRWLKLILNCGRFDDAMSLAQWTITEIAPETASVEIVQEFRVRALLKAGRPREALSAARALFNVAGMETTDRAILLFAECVNACNPDDPLAVDRFRREQIAAASPATRPAGGKTILSVPIDAKPYQDAIRRYDSGRYVVRANELRELTGHGNLLLLAGRVREASAVFDRGLKIAESDQLSLARENVARAIKAEDGAIGRANAWIDSKAAR